MNKEMFSGVDIPKEVHVIRCINAAICEDGKFNICAVHSLPGFDRDTFPGWISALHCKPIPASQIGEIKRYLINYFLCPEGDTYDVEAAYRSVFGKEKQEEHLNGKVVLKIGRWTLLKDVKE